MMAIAGFTAVPNRQTSQTALVNDTNTFFSEIGQFVTDANELAVDVNNDATAAEGSASTASSAAATATSAAGAAVAASGATVWVSGASYMANTSAVISPANQQTYRAKLTHSEVTTDPSVDPTNWTPIGVDGAALLSSAKLFSLFIGA